MKHIEVGKKEGKLHFGGERHGDKGGFIQPTLFLDVDEDASIARNEIFGPVAIINKCGGLAAGAHTLTHAQVRD
jgi:acyl-CoA reductase-like NAD-dependent aldehyde dehydrogenase